MKKKVKNNQGLYLKEIVTGFIIDKKITSEETKNIILKLIDKIGMTLVTLHVNEFSNGGFDIFCGIKESCVYLGYWKELNYIRIFLSSCKSFDLKIFARFIKKFFKLRKEIFIQIINDDFVENEVLYLNMKSL